MMQKPWFKAFMWFMATAFFFAASGIAISYFSPGPTETQTMRFMAGMMAAMHNSLMGLSMALEEDPVMRRLIYVASSMTVPLALSGAVLAIWLRLRGGDRHASKK